LPVGGFDLSGVEIPMEVGEVRNCCSYACAAATPALLEPPLVALALLVLVLVVVLLLLLLHALISTAEVMATVAAKVFLIRASFLAGARGTRAVDSQLIRV
jgi:hypothetical protein